LLSNAREKRFSQLCASHEACGLRQQRAQMAALPVYLPLFQCVQERRSAAPSSKGCALPQNML